MSILIVEDDKKTAAFLRKGLSENGFAVDAANRGEEVLHLARTRDYDIIILDVMLPERDGWSVLAEIRRSGKQPPVLFLTARDSVQDRVKGLELGADDYLIKPFAFSELLARVRSVLRRGPARQPEAVRFQNPVDELPDRPELGARPHHPLALWRQGLLERLSYHPPVHP
jgi:two-component system copper resistance phosphate regulon response regulator CusR